MNKTTNQNGFTLTELIVSISIIVIMSTLFMVNYRAADDQMELPNTAQRLISDIRLVQNYSLGFLDSPIVETSQGGWGIHFKQGDNFYTIFTDLDNNKLFLEADDRTHQVVSLPKGISISALYEGGSEVGLGNELNIVFLPPVPTIFVNEIENSSAQIALKNLKDQTLTVGVNFFGLIEIVE